MTGKGLVPVATTINEDVLKRFKEQVIRKHGRLFGVYKEELTQAIMNQTEKLKKGGGDDECGEQNIVH